MARKVIIDCDPGIDRAIALSLALFDPQLEVVAVTATEGNVSAEQASRNVQAVIEQLDPPRLPRVGKATPADNAALIDGRKLHGEDGLGNARFAVSELHHQHPSEKIICDEVRQLPDEVTLIALGPLTNVARAFQRDPTLSTIVSRVIIQGGSTNGIGDATAAAEFNMYFDPVSAQAVFRSPTTKTLIPLNVTKQVQLDVGFLEQLPEAFTHAGRFLRRCVPFAYRAHHQHLGLESIYVHDVVALLAAVYPEHFEMTEMAGDVETAGEIATGVTVFDRRPKPAELPNMEVATSVDVKAIKECLLRCLAHAGDCS